MPTKTEKKVKARKIVRAKCEQCGKTYDKKVSLICNKCRKKNQIQRQKEMYSSPHATSVYVKGGEMYYKNKK